MPDKPKPKKPRRWTYPYPEEVEARIRALAKAAGVPLADLREAYVAHLDAASAEFDPAEFVLEREEARLEKLRASLKAPEVKG